MASKPKRERDKTRIDESEGGSATLRNLAGKAMAKRQKKESEAAAAQEKRDALAAKKAEAAAAAAALLAAFERHHALYGPILPGRACACPEQPCPMANMVRCLVCGDIKKSVCRKATCKPAAPLALTCGPAPATPLAAVGAAVCMAIPVPPA